MQANRPLRIAAAVFSATLLAVYVGYRSGAVSQTPEAPIDAETDPFIVFPSTKSAIPGSFGGGDVDPPTDDDEPELPMFLPGSKSGGFLIDPTTPSVDLEHQRGRVPNGSADQPTKPRDEAPPPRRTFMSGSKSMVLSDDWVRPYFRGEAPAPWQQKSDLPGWLDENNQRLDDGLFDETRSTDPNTPGESLLGDGRLDEIETPKPKP